VLMIHFMVLVQKFFILILIIYCACIPHKVNFIISVDISDLWNLHQYITVKGQSHEKVCEIMTKNGRIGLN
jgi:hypothetical protein